MEGEKTNEQSGKGNSKIFILIFAGILAFILVATGGYLIGHKSAKKQVAVNTIQNDQSALSTTNLEGQENLKNITYLMRFYDANQPRTIYVTADGTSSTLKMADINLSNSKTLYKLGLGAFNFQPPFHLLKDYFIIPISGGDANDILIFTVRGDTISLGVRKTNPQLGGWIVQYDSWVKDKIIKVKLFQIDNSTGTAEIDLSTGKLVPDSYKLTGKLP